VSNLLMLPSSAGGNVVNIGQTAEEAAKFLAGTGEFFRKGECILRCVDDEKAGKKLELITVQKAQTLLFDLMTVQFWHTDRRGNVSLRPATEIKESTVKAILAGHHVGHLPPIAIVAAHAYLILVDDQLVTLKPGYNPELGGILVTRNEQLAEVRVEEAATALLALLDDFWFATPSDRSRAIGSLFCAAFRLAGIFERHPLLVFEADQSQTGKTLLWAMLCDILGQSFATATKKAGGVGSLDETLMEKMVAGHTCILFDNARGRFDSQFFEACMTSEGGQIYARVPGVREIPVDPDVVVFGMTSNAAELTIDLSERSLMTRVRKQPPTHVFRTYTDDSGHEISIRQHIQARHAFYHGCVNAIIRHWWEHGAQRRPCTEHSFKQTIGAVDFIVQNHFALPPLLDGHRISLDRTTKPGLTWLRQIALTAADQWQVLEWTASRIAERCQQDGVAIPGAGERDEPLGRAQQIGTIMASAFGKEERIQIDDIAILRSSTTDGSGRTMKVYSFLRSRA